MSPESGNYCGCTTPSNTHGLYKANNCTIVLVFLDLASSVYSTPGPQFYIKENGQVLSKI